jgi:hypothetical protein
MSWDDDEESPAQRRRREYDEWAEDERRAKEAGERDAWRGIDHSSDYRDEHLRRSYEKEQESYADFKERKRLDGEMFAPKRIDTIGIPDDSSVPVSRSTPSMSSSSQSGSGVLPPNNIGAYIITLVGLVALLKGVFGGGIVVMLLGVGLLYLGYRSAEL